MASLTNKNNRYELQFMQGGKRKTVFLGQVTESEAGVIKARVEAIALSNKLDQPLSASDQKWISQLQDSIHEKLAEKGLFPSRVREETPEFRLSYLLDEYMAMKKREGIRKGTVIKLEQAFSDLRAFFAKDPLITEITHEQAAKWRKWLIEKGNQRTKVSRPLSERTVCKRTQNAKEAFNHAVREGWIKRNPFSQLPSRVEPNREREFYVKPELAAKVIAAIRNPEVKLAFVLARYAGLRCPSEICLLRWEDINLESRTMVIRSPKTERHGKDMRDVPIFPPLHNLLLHLIAESSEKPEGHVAERCRKLSPAAIGKGIKRAIKSIGEVPWPSLMNNLRKSFVSDLYKNKVAPHLAGSIAGHSPKMALEFYARHTASDLSELSSLDIGAGVLQSVLQSGAASSRADTVTETEEPQEIQGNDDTSQLVTASEDSREEGENGRRGTRTPDIYFVRVAL